MQIINLTPHAITLRNAEGVDTTLPPSGMVARVGSTPGVLRTVEGCPVPIASATTYTEVDGIPPPGEGILYLVSAMVLGRTTRRDVVAPGTGPSDGAIRNPQGQIVAVTRLIAAV